MRGRAKGWENVPEQCEEDVDEEIHAAACNEEDADGWEEDGDEY